MSTAYSTTDFIKCLASCAFGLLLIGSAPAVVAAGNTQYEQDVARCRSGHSGQDLDTCLREARAARAAAGRLNDDAASGEQYDKNAFARCQALPEPQRQHCITLMRSPTNVQGSVEGGGVLRETVITVPAPGQPGVAPGRPDTAPVYDNRGGVYVPAPMR